MDRKRHWEGVYEKKRSTEVSWYQAEPELSLRLVREHLRRPKTSIIDVGGGASKLVDRLLEHPEAKVSVLDLSAAALRETRERLGERAAAVSWMEGDILNTELEENAYDIWHDRAVFHFLTRPEDRRLYVAQVLRSVRAGGHVLVATFGADGPQKCSGLEVARYSPVELHAQFGDGFRLLKSTQEDHITPGGTIQKFVYCVWALEGVGPPPITRPAARTSLAP